MRSELIVIDGEEYEIAKFPTAPWNTVGEYLSAKNKARYAANFRPGTFGANRPTGALRTVDEWKLLRARIESAVSRSARTVVSFCSASSLRIVSDLPPFRCSTQRSPCARSLIGFPRSDSVTSLARSGTT